MTTSENIGNTMQATFDDIDDDIKADYGEQYLKDFKANFEFSIQNSSPKVYKVLNALEMAISLEDPDAVYRPCRNIAAQAFYKIFETMPKVLTDFIFVKVYGYITGFPVPKEATNS